jgi:hypothetical protein
VSILDELGLAEADLGSLALDAPERSLAERSRDAELAEYEADLAEKRPEERGREDRHVRVRERRLAEWIAFLRDRNGLSLKEAAATVAEGGYDGGEIDAALRLVETEEDGEPREPRDTELADGDALDEAFGGEGEVEALVEELAAGWRDASL